jgi:formate/nitrite transporter FocA (FNT family)
MLRRGWATFRNVLRLWSVVLLANMAGVLAIAWVLGNTGVFRPEVQKAFAEIGRESLAAGFGLQLLRGIFAGWLIAFMVWLLPFAEAFRVVVIVALTWLIGIGQLPHVIAGSVAVLLLATTGAASVQQVVTGYLIPVLIGNIVGGVALVAALNHAQVVSE